MKTIKISIDGLSCAHCAEKIETQIKKMAFVDDVLLNFAKAELRFALRDNAPATALSDIVSFISKTEPGVAFRRIYVVEKKPASKAAGFDMAQVMEFESVSDAEEYISGKKRTVKRPNGKQPKRVIKPGLILLLIAVALAVLSYLPALPPIVRSGLLIASILLSGYPIFILGIKKLIHLEIEEDLLMSIAVVAACALGDFPEAAMVALLFRLGTYLEDIAVARSRKNIDSLTAIRPDMANLLDAQGEIKAVPAKTVPVGSLILIKPGERVPLDSTITIGSSDMDNSVITGESIPVAVAAGDRVLSGTVNGAGLLTCTTVSDFNSSTASRIIELVESSLAKKGKTEKFISRFSKYYTPIVIFLAAGIAVIPPFLGLGDFNVWVYRSLIFLVSSCPCALVISVPLGFFAGIGSVSKLGVLIKGGKYLEALAKADCVVFDKTGTLTSGKLKVSKVTSVSDVGESEVVRLAAICENYSNHPIAKAVVEYYGQPISKSTVFSCEETAGMGVKASYLGSELLCGSDRLMKANGIDTSAFLPANIYVAKDRILIGQINITDELRSDSAQAVTALKATGVNNVMIFTGDTEPSAAAAAKACGADAYRASLLPADKVQALLAAKEGRKSVLFVGDGINDAPVLAAADVGVAMGLGSDAAIEAADAVLISESLESLPKAILLSRRAMGVIVFNIIFALAVKAIVLVLGVFGLAAMWLAVFADVGVTIIAVLNATRILRMHKQFTR